MSVKLPNTSLSARVSIYITFRYLLIYNESGFDSQQKENILSTVYRPDPGVHPVSYPRTLHGARS